MSIKFHHHRSKSTSSQRMLSNETITHINAMWYKCQPDVCLRVLWSQCRNLTIFVLNIFMILMWNYSVEMFLCYKMTTPHTHATNRFGKLLKEHTNDVNSQSSKNKNAKTFQKIFCTNERKHEQSENKMCQSHVNFAQ